MTLQEYLIDLKPMSEGKANEIAGFFEAETICKGNLLVQEGKTSQHSFFLEEGIVRCYTLDLNGDEVTTRLFSAPDFINDYRSFFRREASQENYEAVTDLKVQKIGWENVQHCFHSIPDFREWGRMMLTMNYVHLQEQMLSMHKESARERYENLLRNRPEIIQNVPVHIVASYLGVTKFSLSRIRKEVSSN
ncbi:MAG: cyclic nucleotide-binding domain-containing protein [Crocinitomicaceae bacterium]